MSAKGSPQIVSSQAHAKPTITAITRRALFEEMGKLVTSGIHWSAGQPEHEVLARVFDLDALPSDDRRAENMGADIWLHREHFAGDWPDDWLFTDTRLDLLRCPDE